MTRDALKVTAFWDRWIEHYVYEIGHRAKKLSEPFVKEDYRPQYAYEQAKTHFWLVMHRYSRGDPIAELAQYMEPLLHYWEEAERLGQDVWTPAQQISRHSWAVNLDHYIDCFWLVGLAVALNIPDSQWQRLIALVGNEGEDTLLDRIIATRQPNRRIGVSLCYPKPYARLLDTIDASPAKQAKLLAQFVDHWYVDIGKAAKTGRQKQAVPYKEPYWHGYHKIEGGYFGYWCLEAVAAVKACHLDDSACIGHPHYPGDLLHPNKVTAGDPSRLPAILAGSIGAPPEPPFVAQPRNISTWEALKLVIKNKLS